MSFLNIVTLLPKIDEIQDSILNKNIEVIAFNETRLDSNISDGIVHVNDYDIIRKDIGQEMEEECVSIYVAP